MPTLFKQLQAARDHEPEPPGDPVISVGRISRRSRSGKIGHNRTSLARVEARREFLRTTTKGAQDEVYTNPESLPSVEVAYNNFQRIYPKFSETWAIDDLRDREYFHLEESQHVCMDYCGFGLFSYYQQVIHKAASSFGLAYISANLPTHALYGAADEGTTEFYIRKRVMDYLNINDTEYSMVFTASRGSAFKLLAESYPFHLNPKLLTVYDFESEAVSWMTESAKQKGAKIMSACFKWPSLRIGTSHLKKLIQEKKKKSESAKGLFVFPVQSRMTGAKYSYQWMSQAQQNKWHVLLDASGLGPKDMDSLGLSLFRPDFIVSSFYKVFGTDPTGFGCLFIKNTVINSLHNSSRARGVGMVRIVSLSNYAMDGPDFTESEEDDGEDEVRERAWGFEQDNVHATRSFSGPYFTAMETELKPEDVRKANSQRPWNSWKRHGKIASHNIEHSGPLTGSSLTPMDTVSETDEGGSSEIGNGLTKSEYYSESRALEIDVDQPIRGSRIGHSWDFTRRLNGGSMNEILELEDDSAIEVGNNGRFTDPQWRLQGRVTEIEEEDERMEFRTLVGHGISPILEEDAEDQETEELEECRVRSKASDTGNRSGRTHSPLSDEQTGGRASDIDEEAVDLGRNFANDLNRNEAEPVEVVETMRWDSSDEEDVQHGASLNRWKTASEEIADGNLSVRGRQHKVNDVTAVEEVRESRDSLPSGEANSVLKRNELGKQAAGTASRRLSAGGNLTGNVEEELTDTEGDPKLRKQGELSFIETNTEAIREYAGREASAPAGEILSTEDVVEPIIGKGPGSSKQWSDNGGFPQDHSLTGCPGPSSERWKTLPTLTSRESQVVARKEASDFYERGRSGNPSLVRNSSFSDESSEENYETILHSKTGKSSSVPETASEARTSGSQELSDIESSSSVEKETGQREHISTMDNSPSPESKLRVEHSGDEERSFKSSRRSLSIESDSLLPSVSTPIHHMATLNCNNYRNGQSTEDISFDTEDFHDARDQSLGNGRSDLRSNRTLSRDVDFEDEMYSGRSANASEMFTSRRESMTLAEDIGQMDMQDSDEESFFESQYYSGSFPGSSSSRYLADELPTTRYQEGDESERDDDFEEISDVDLWEGEGEPIISCKGLDFADSLGLTKLNYRLRYLVNWLVSSLLKLRHPGPNQGIPLVRIYGPKVKYDRGAAVSFNIFDWKGLLIQPGLVQRLADRSNISLGVGRLCNIVDPEMFPDFLAEKERLSAVDRNDQDLDSGSQSGRLEAGKLSGIGNPLRIPVVTAAMGFVTSFEDVYKLWSFVAKFLDADFVSKEVWRYHSLNQQTIVM